LAQEADLDLVEVAPNSKPPVAKIMDFGKFKYETAQKAKEARRNQANTILKEVRFRLKIDTHDYETKRKRAEGFLQAGDKVKAMILFRGREQSRPEQGVRLLQRFAEDVSEFGSVESTPTIDGRNMVMVIGPLKNKAEAKAEAEAKRVSSKPARTAETAPVVAKTEFSPVIETMEADTTEAKTEAATDARAEAPKTDSPVEVQKPAEAPKAEALKAEAPKAEAPKAEAQKAETTPVAKPVAKPAASAAPVPTPGTPKPAAAKPAAAKPTAAKPATPKTTATPKPAAATTKDKTDA
jgi:translation initiation factor IF-3